MDSSSTPTPLELSQLEDFLLLDALVDDHQATLSPSSNQLIVSPNHADSAALEWPCDQLLINGIESGVADWSQQPGQISDHDYGSIDHKNTPKPTSNSLLLMGNSRINGTAASVSLLMGSSRINGTAASVSGNTSGLLRYNILSPSLYPRTSLDYHAAAAGYNTHASTQLHRRPNPGLDALTWAINPSANCLEDVCPADDELAFARSCLSALDLKRATKRPADYGLNLNFKRAIKAPDCCGLHLKPMKLKQCKFGFKLSTNVETESKRRKHMTRLFYTLRALLPKQLVPQNDRCKLIEETCNYIRELEKELESLRRKAKILNAVMKMNDGRESYSSRDTKMGRGFHNDDDNIVDGGEAQRAQVEGKSRGRIKDDNNRNNDHGNDGVDDDGDGGEAPHVEVACAIGGKVVHICMGCQEKVAGLFPTILGILDRHGLDVVKESFTLSRTTINELQAELHIKAKLKS